MKMSTGSGGTVSKRLWTAFALLVALPVCALGAMLVIVSQHALVGNWADQSRQTIEQMARSIDEDADQISLWAAALSSDTQILAAASAFARGPTPSDRAVAAQVLDSKMISFFDYTNRIGSVQVLYSHYTPYLYRNSSFLFELPVDQGDWFNEVVGNPGRTHFLDDLRSYSIGHESRPVLSVAVSPSSKPPSSQIAVFLVSFRIAALDAIDADAAPGRELLLLDERGRPILSTADGVVAADAPLHAETRSLLRALSSRGTPSLSNTSLALSIDGRRFLVTVAGIPATSWRLVSSIPYAEITARVDAFTRLAQLSFLVLLVLFIAYIEVAFRELIMPLRVLVKKMAEVGTGNYAVSVDPRGPREIALLSEAFNSMVREVDRLTGEKEAKERERARLELEALRLQINPHFLSNTLNSIRLMAVMTKTTNIQDMTSALMKIVANSLSKEGALDTVKSEIELLRSYVHVMKVRYGESFSVHFDVDTQTESLFMMRMLLQPIVENSILHGFRNLLRKGRIDVRSRIDEKRLRFEIQDNGVGMDAAAVVRAFHQEAPDALGLNRVGLRNVYRRIHLNYTGDYGVTVCGNPGVGTTVVMTLPVITEVTGDVSNISG